MKIGIVGFGRFGALLAELLSQDFDLLIYDGDQERLEQAKKLGYKTAGISEMNSCKYVFLAVPIANIQDSLEHINAHLSGETTVIDVASVKVYPTNLMQKHLSEAKFLATHPLFGPDSVKNGLDGLKLAVCGGTDEQAEEFWVEYWQSRGLDVIRTTPDNHDHDMIYSLGLTQTLARMINRMDTPKLTLTTKNFDAVNAVLRLALSDTDQLYHDMLHYNPYFKEMQQKFKKAADITGHNLKEILAEEPDV